tara:strand:- start:2539 stop:2805 length:267 start_codon:yes stop_codon:yes gene_type:complete
MKKVKKEYHLRFMVDDTVYDRYHDSQELLAERFKSVQYIYRERCTLVFLEEYNPVKHPKKKTTEENQKPEPLKAGRSWPSAKKLSDWW